MDDPETPEKTGRYTVHHRPDKPMDPRDGTVPEKRDGRKLTGTRSGPSRIPSLLQGSLVRKVRIRSRPGYTGGVPMTRIKRKVVSGESMLELDFLVVIDDVMPDLVDVVAQPMTFRLPIGPKGSQWTPDFLLVHRHGQDEIVEIKTEKTLHPVDPDRQRVARARVDAMRKVANGAGYRFRLATEREIRVQPRLANARLVHRAMNPCLAVEDVLAARSALVGLDAETSVHAFRQSLPDRLRSSALTLAIRLEREGLIRFDRSRAIDRHAAFRIERGGE